MRNVRMIAVALVSVILWAGSVKAVGAPQSATLPVIVAPAPVFVRIQADRLDPIPAIVFRHGDISWLPSLAAQAGWEPRHIKKLGQFILRESGGCPNRRGGDAVDLNCNITHVTEWTHRSDTGLLQVNGLNWDSKRIGRPAFLCKKIGVCTQEPLLDPLTNLKAGKALFDEAGWSPWNPQPKKPKKP